MTFFKAQKSVDEQSIEKDSHVQVHIPPENIEGVLPALIFKPWLQIICYGVFYQSLALFFVLVGM